VSLAWVAGSVRASLLASRRLGRAGARALADHGSLEDAVRELSGSPYGHDVAAAKSLEEAQRAVAATLLWHLRVLAGWLPPPGGELLTVMAAWFEIANVQDRLAYFAGEPYRPAFELGSLRTAWPALAQTRSAEQMRLALAGSRWGDPGSSEPAAVAAAMRATWAGRLAAAVPEAAGWARSAAALLVAREASCGDSPSKALGRIAGLGDSWPRLESPADLAPLLPADLRWVLAGVDGPEDLWQAESRWWSRLEADAGRLTAARRQGRETVVGVVALLAVDAWRVRAALAAAALGQAGREAFDAVA
jgi:hypothetical protein